MCDGDAATRSAASIARATHTSNRISLTNGACQSIRVLALLLLCSGQVSSSHPTLLVPMPRTTGATGASLGADSRLHLPEEARARAEDDAEDEAERAEHPCDLRLGPGEPPRRRHHRAGRQVAVGAPEGKGQEPHGLRQCGQKPRGEGESGGGGLARSGGGGLPGTEQRRQQQAATAAHPPMRRSSGREEASATTAAKAQMATAPALGPPPPGPSAAPIGGAWQHQAVPSSDPFAACAVSAAPSMGGVSSAIPVDLFILL